MSDQTRAHCNKCERETHHDVLHSITDRWESEPEDHGFTVSGSDTYETLRCRGCDDIKLRHTSWFSEADEPAIAYFPPSTFRKKPKWFDEMILELPEGSEFVETLAAEIYVALQNGLPSLAAMGVRSLLEKVMVASVGDQGSFAANLNKFELQGHVANRQRERMEAILEVGHASIHRHFKPSAADLSTLMDISEHILESLYLHDAKVQKLRARTPPRPPRVKT